LIKFKPHPKRMFDKFSTGNFYLREHRNTGTGGRGQGAGFDVSVDTSGRMG
jgi:hypothetical protein